MDKERIRQMQKDYDRLMGPTWRDWVKVLGVGALGGGAFGLVLLLLADVPMAGLGGLIVFFLAGWLLLRVDRLG